MSIETASTVFTWVLIPAEVFVVCPMVIFMVCITICDAVREWRGRP